METGLIAAYGPRLLAAVQDGRVGEALVDERVRNILRTYFRFGIFDRPLPASVQPVPVEEHGGLAREIEYQAITLLKNRNSALPLQRPRQPGSIAVLGEAAARAVQQCCAAAITNPTYTISPLEGIRGRAPQGVDVQFERGIDPPGPWDMLPGPEAIPSSVLSPPASPGQIGVRAQFWNNATFTGAPVVTRTDPRPAFDTGAIFPFGQPHLVFPPTGAQAVRYTGTITAPRSGSYRLSLSGFGTGRLVFQGREIVSFTNQTEPRAYVSDPVTLVAGQSYDFRVEYAATNPFTGGLEPGTVRLGWITPVGTLSPDAQAAVDLAESSDVAVVVANAYEAEQRDRAQLDLPTAQDELIDAVSRANPRTIVVLETGGPVTMPWIGQVNGILQAYYGGAEQGRAIADVLFGDVNRPASCRFPTRGSSRSRRRSASRTRC
jgi:beta-glucosidase